jgi:asparagine synthase (glutamine-hydrolysing)
MCGILCMVSKIRGGNIQTFINQFNKLSHRGPDSSKSSFIPDGENVISLGFHRLAINDSTSLGMGPFEFQGMYCIANGEIYNWKKLAKEYLSDYTFNSDCDTEILLYLYHYFDKDVYKLCNVLDGEYSFVIYDQTIETIHCCTDELSTRPVYIGKTKKDEEEVLWFSSELIGIPSDNLTNLIRVQGGTCHTIKLPGKDNSTLEEYVYYKINTNVGQETPNLDHLQKLLVENVEKKLYSSINYKKQQGFFLSGGLDSSLIASIASLSVYPDKIKTFSFGFDSNAPDLGYAKKVSEFIGSEHYEIIFSMQDTFDNLDEIIKILGSYDQTTVRASSALYMGTKWIKEKFPDISVMITGELSDELFGSYLYMFKAPNDQEFTKERHNLLENVHNFDGLRCDRICAHFGIEARYPFFSRQLLDYINSIDPSYLAPSNSGVEKNILRQAFKSNWLPKDVLNRQKEALSDGTSENSSWKDFIKEKCKSHTLICDGNGNGDGNETLEDLLYKKIFDKHYPNELQANTIPYKWMPKWICLDSINHDSSASLLLKK